MRIRFFCFVSFFLCLWLFPFSVFAQTAPATVDIINPIGGTAENPEGVTNIAQIVGRVLKQATTVIGSLAFLAFLFGGFMWMTSEGSSDKVKTGLNTMVFAAVGMFVIFGSYAILNTILNSLGLQQSSDVLQGNSVDSTAGDEACRAVEGGDWQCIHIDDERCRIVTAEGATISDKRTACGNSPQSCRLNRCVGEFIQSDVVCCRVGDES